jgi:hypothetical protein
MGGRCRARECDGCGELVHFDPGAAGTIPPPGLRITCRPCLQLAVDNAVRKNPLDPELWAFRLAYGL